MFGDATGSLRLLAIAETYIYTHVCIYVWKLEQEDAHEDGRCLACNWHAWGMVAVLFVRLGSDDAQACMNEIECND